jgi:trigger factor
MKSTVDKLEGLSRKINVEVPAAKVQQAFDRVYKTIQKKANIKGFRPGKAPINTIKSMYGEQVASDVINELFNEAYPAALDQHSLEPVGYPKVNFTQPPVENADFLFSAEFEVRPDVEVAKFEGLSVLKEKMESLDDRVNTILENIRSGQAESVTVFEDRALSEGDVAVVDFNGKVGGQPLPGGSAEGHELEIGAKQFIEGFEEGLIGMKAGDSRVLNLRFPEGYHEASLSGAPVDFDVTLKAIKRKVIPEMTDELAAKLGGDFKTVEELKERISKDIEASEDRRIRDDMRNRIVKSLVEANPVDAPKSLVDQQKAALIEDFKGKMKQQGMTDSQFDEYKTKWDADFTDSATFMVKSTFLIDALADKLSLRATPAEIEAKIAEYGSQTGIEPERLQEFYGKPERRSRLSFQVTEEKVIDYLIGKANVTEVTKEQLA